MYVDPKTQNRNRLGDAENTLKVAGVGAGTWVKKVKGNEVQTSSYKMNKSQGCNVQPGEDSQCYCHNCMETDGY